MIQNVSISYKKPECGPTAVYDAYNDAIFPSSWFSFSWTDDELATTGGYCCGFRSRSQTGFASLQTPLVLVVTSSHQPRCSTACEESLLTA